MRKEILKELSTESLLEQRKKIHNTIKITVIVSIIVVVFLLTNKRLNNINIIHMIVAGAVIGGIIELIINAARIRKELKARDLSNN